MLKVIDVSEHQGAIDWAKVKPNIDAAIIRLGYGSDEASQDDKKWNYNVGECERLGIPFGAYIYSYADTENKARSEATHTIRQLKGHKFSLPVYFDAEEARCGSFAESAFKIWDKLVADAGYKTGLYSGYYYRRSYMGGAQPKSWWMAWYAAEAYVKTHMLANWKYDGWQYTSSGSCPGITSRGLDVSYFYIDLGETEKKPENALDLAYHVMDQKINGSERKKYLGTMYEEVQSLINHIHSADIDTLVSETLSGKYGTGNVRKTVLGARYQEVQDAINEKPKLAVDGILGSETIKAWQKSLGVTVDGKMGPETVKAVQRWAGATEDGLLGPETRKAVQRKLGVTADGIWGKTTISAMQTYLNNH